MTSLNRKQYWPIDAPNTINTRQLSQQEQIWILTSIHRHRATPESSAILVVGPDADVGALLTGGHGVINLDKDSEEGQQLGGGGEGADVVTVGGLLRDDGGGDDGPVLSVEGVLALDGDTAVCGGVLHAKTDHQLIEVQPQPQVLAGGDLVGAEGAAGEADHAQGVSELQIEGLLHLVFLLGC